jgi:hypothetical protein
LQAQRGPSLTAYDRVCSLLLLESQEGMMQTRKQLQVFEQVSTEAHSVLLKTAADSEPLIHLSGSCDVENLVAALQQTSALHCLLTETLKKKQKNSSSLQHAGKTQNRITKKAPT